MALQNLEKSCKESLLDLQWTCGVDGATSREDLTMRCLCTRKPVFIK